MWHHFNLTWQPPARGPRPPAPSPAVPLPPLGLTGASTSGGRFGHTSCLLVFPGDHVPPLPDLFWVQTNTRCSTCAGCLALQVRAPTRSWNGSPTDFRTTNEQDPFLDGQHPHCITQDDTLLPFLSHSLYLLFHPFSQTCFTTQSILVTLPSVYVPQANLHYHILPRAIGSSLLFHKKYHTAEGQSNHWLFSVCHEVKYKSSSMRIL